MDPTSKIFHLTKFMLRRVSTATPFTLGLGTSSDNSTKAKISYLFIKSPKTHDELLSFSKSMPPSLAATTQMDGLLSTLPPMLLTALIKPPEHRVIKAPIHPNSFSLTSTKSLL